MSTRRVRTARSGRPPFRVDESRTIKDVVHPPIVSGGDLLITRRRGSLEAIDESSGAARWSVKLAGVADDIYPHAGAPIVSSGVVHVWAGGELVSVHLETGDVANRRQAPGLDLKDGILIDGCVITYVEGGRLEAWDIPKGTRRWSVDRSYDPVPIAGAGQRAVVAGPASISAYDVREGLVVWTHRLTGDEAIGALAITPNGAIVVAVAQRLVALDTASGSVLWTSATAVARTGTMAVTDTGVVHLMDLSRYQRLDAATGSVLWSGDLDRGGMPSVRGSLGRLTVSESHVFGADVRGPLVGVSLASGSIDWTWNEERRRAASDAPVLSGQRLYARDLDGTLQTFVEAG